MPLDKQTIDQIKAGIDAAATLGETFAPQFIPFIVLGQAVAKMAPALYNDIAAMFGDVPPTEEEKQALAEKIAALGNPESL